MFTGKHTEETKRKISESRRKYKGEKHPRFGAEWTDDQRAKYILTMHEKRVEEKRIKMFIIKYDILYKKFQQEIKNNNNKQ